MTITLIKLLEKMNQERINAVEIFRALEEIEKNYLWKAEDFYLNSNIDSRPYINRGFEILLTGVFWSYGWSMKKFKQIRGFLEMPEIGGEDNYLRYGHANFVTLEGYGKEDRLLLVRGLEDHITRNKTIPTVSYVANKIGLKPRVLNVPPDINEKYKREITKLKREIEILKKENEKLRSMLAKSNGFEAFLEANKS